MSRLELISSLTYAYVRTYICCQKKRSFSVFHSRNTSHMIQHRLHFQHYFNAINYSTKIIQTSFFFNSQMAKFLTFSNATEMMMISMYLWKINWRRFGSRREDRMRENWRWAWGEMDEKNNWSSFAHAIHNTQWT